MARAHPVPVSVLLVALALLAPSAPAQVSEIQRATARVKPAVVYIQAEFGALVAFNQEVFGPVYTGAVGSGFIIRQDGFVVTNAHVVEPTEGTAQRIKANFALMLINQLPDVELTEANVAEIVANSLLIDSEGLALKAADIPTEVKVLTKGGLQQVKGLVAEFPAEVRSISPMLAKDVAILKINGSNFPSAALGDSDAVQLQDPVTVIGYPGVVQETFERAGLFGGDSQMEVSITQGVVSSLKTWHDGSSILGTDAGAAHGNSGGPAINRNGEVIGILSMGAVSGQSDSYPFNFLRPINVAKDFIRANGVDPQTGLTDTLYAEGLDAFWEAESLTQAGKAGAAGKSYTTAKDKLQSVVNLYNQHPDAPGYLVRIEEAMVQLPSAGFPVTPVLIGVAAVVLGALVFVALGRRRSAAPAPAPAPQPAAAAAPQQAAAAAAGRFRLVAEAGALAGNHFDVGPEGLTIGRDPASCQVVCQGDMVSRQHARVHWSGGNLVVTTLSTTNKTFVNEQPISQVSVRPGDRVRISDSVFLIQG